MPPKIPKVWYTYFWCGPPPGGGGAAQRDAGLSGHLWNPLRIFCDPEGPSGLAWDALGIYTPSLGTRAAGFARFAGALRAPTAALIVSEGTPNAPGISLGALRAPEKSHHRRFAGGPRHVAHATTHPPGANYVMIFYREGGGPPPGGGVGVILKCSSKCCGLVGLSWDCPANVLEMF